MSETIPSNKKKRTIADMLGDFEEELNNEMEHMYKEIETRDSTIASLQGKLKDYEELLEVEAEQAKTIDSLKQENQRLKDENTRLHGKVASMATSIANLNAAIDSFKQQVSDLGVEVAKLTGKNNGYTFILKTQADDIDRKAACIKRMEDTAKLLEKEVASHSEDADFFLGEYLKLKKELDKALFRAEQERLRYRSIIYGHIGMKRRYKNTLDKHGIEA
jgi:chromosome segregation ATPase